MSGERYREYPHPMGQDELEPGSAPRLGWVVVDHGDPPDYERGRIVSRHRKSQQASDEARRLNEPGDAA